MRVLRDNSEPGDPRGAVVTIGVFDGVHCGHQVVLAEVVEQARRLDAVASVVTFDPHPARVIDPEHAPLSLETLERRLARFEALGIAQVRVINFDAAASREDAESFVERVLVGELRVRRVIVGEDFHFGRDRGGNAERLAAWGTQHGFGVQRVALVGGAERHSSTTARAMVRHGDLVEAERVLGHRVLAHGVVVHGDSRGGAQLGYPTVNLALGESFVRPGEGVYAGAARLASGQWHAAAISIGRRPQFYEHGEVLVEAHLVGFDGDLYDQSLDLVFLRFLRGEAKFDSVEDLVAQMGRDVAETVNIFSEFSSNPEILLASTSGQRR